MKKFLQTAGSYIEKLPFKKLAQSKIPQSQIAKFPLLGKAITFANLIVCGLALVLVITVIACLGKNGSAAGAGEDLAKAGKMIKGKGKEYTLSKDTDFMYDLTKIDGKDYVIIQGINLPKNFKFLREKPTGKKNAFGSVIYKWLINDTIIIKIPEKIEGYTVGAIDNNPFDGHSMGEKYVTSVTIPDSVIEIGEVAFSGSSICSIKLPKSLKKIGEGAFSMCKNLGGSVTIPDGVTEIPEETFSITGINEVIIPDSVTIIGQNAFTSCTELKSVELPSRPMQYLFWDISEKKYVTTVFGYVEYTQEDHGAFEGCSKLSLATRNKIKETGYKGRF